MKCAKMTFSEAALSADRQAYSAYRQSKLLEAEMLCLLLERMELSQGFNNHEKKTNRPHTSKITLLPRKQVMASLAAAKDFLIQQEAAVTLPSEQLTQPRVTATAEKLSHSSP